VRTRIIKRFVVTACRLEFGGNGRAGKVVFTDTRFGLGFDDDAMIVFLLVKAVELAILECIDLS
jgi:hypothetical protein